ncbi:MAG TPA: leucyl/phenylalanyl-tRNA--protein transferase [Polyangia bacterium]|nr:leucyl/phenylalanyl-tRNA--protein transferase [Polyangia bacterium]
MDESRSPPATDDALPEAGALGELHAGEGGLLEGWPDGLVAVGGSLDPDRLVTAYRAGIFPWSSDPAVTWWSPDPRAIFDLETWRPHRSVGRSGRRAGWRFTIDRDFAGVMRACGESTELRPATWITDEFLRAYGELHRRGLAHSIEVWEGEALVGGLYGVTLGGFFGGESMFHRRTDASKAAVAYLVERLRAGGFTLLDAQVQTPHLERLGATTIPRAEYLRRLRAALPLRCQLDPGP